VIASFFEGISLTMLEAMCNGLIVIGSDTVGIKDNVKNNFNGFLFKNKSRESLCEVMKEVVGSMKTERIRNIRTNAVHYFEKNFSFEQSVLRFERIFDKAVTYKGCP